ncbi:uncharacterized protein ccdc14 isoform 2-T2 [Pholidichthys leucotaenia]
MKGKTKRKVLTSGRLTGAVKGSVPSATHPEAAYSLYSTDSEDQVTTLHKGLDRCAALLSGILQADKAASPVLPRTVKGEAAKSRLSSAVGKKTTKKRQIKPTDRKSSQSGPHGPGSTTPRRHQPTALPAHSGVTLHPPQKQPYTQLQSHLSAAHHQTLQHLSHTVPSPLASTPPLKPETSILLSVRQSSSLSVQPPLHQALSEAPQRLYLCDDEEEIIPVRDLQSAAADSYTQPHIDTGVAKVSDMQLEAEQDDNVPEDTQGREECSSKTETKSRTVQYLLRELKALITGEGSVAEQLLSHLELTLTSPQIKVDSSNPQTETVPDLLSLHNQNTQLRRRVRILNQQLKEREKAERHQNLTTLCSSEVLSLQEEVATAQSRLQQLQGELAELRNTLQDTQSQLRDKQAENAAIWTDLKCIRSRLLDSEREKSELASLAQQREEEIETLKQLHQSSVSSHPPDQHFSQALPKQDAPVPSIDRITQYLMSLGYMEPAAHAQQLCVPAERKGATLELRDTSSYSDISYLQCEKPEEMPTRPEKPNQSYENERRQLFNSSLSQCDVESVCSDWSVKSGSTFNTKDEAAFRDGLAALDASIASLQKTLELDMRR